MTPEIEYAIRDGLAVELELPFHNSTLEGCKLAIQGTLPDYTHHFAHGWQMIGRYARHESSYSADMLYIVGYRLNTRWSTLNMLGIRREDIGKNLHLEGLANLNVFYAMNENMALGLESNNAFSGSHWHYSLTPQAHLNFTDWLSLQMGPSYQKHQGKRGTFTLSGRLIYTF